MEVLDFNSFLMAATFTQKQQHTLNEDENKESSLISHIDIVVQMIVYGYINNAQKSLQSIDFNYKIPEIVVYVVLAFYHEREGFSTTAHCMESSKDYKSLTYTGDYFDTCCNKNASYGTIVVDSQSNCICKWYIRIDDSFNKIAFLSDDIQIGIAERNFTKTDIGVSAPNNFIYCGKSWSDSSGMPSLDNAPKEDVGIIIEWIDGNQTKIAYGKAYGKGDEICVVLDLKKRQISFEKNGENLGIAYKDIPCSDNIRYRLCLHAQERPFKCTITRFMRIGCTE
eukprot:497913_1